MKKSKKTKKQKAIKKSTTKGKSKKKETPKIITAYDMFNDYMKVDNPIKEKESKNLFGENI